MAARKPKVINFVSKGAKAKLNNEDGTVVDHGKIGALDYTVYSRGVIHITDGNLVFKKDPGSFEDELEDLDINASLSSTKGHVIPGSGDNADLVFSLDKEDDLVVSLKAKEFSVIKKLRSIIEQGKKQLQNNPKK